jgi:hypothetical protein
MSIGKEELINLGECLTLPVVAKYYKFEKGTTLADAPDWLRPDCENRETIDGIKFVEHRRGENADGYEKDIDLTALYFPYFYILGFDGMVQYAYEGDYIVLYDCVLKAYSEKEFFKKYKMRGKQNDRQRRT